MPILQILSLSITIFITLFLFIPKYRHKYYFHVGIMWMCVIFGWFWLLGLIVTIQSLKELRIMLRDRYANNIFRYTNFEIFLKIIIIAFYFYAKLEENPQPCAVG